MNDVNKPQETELDRILREAASFDEAEEAKRRAAVRKAAQETRATTPKTAPARPERGVPIEKRILANMKANAEKKAEEKYIREEQQAVEAQKAALENSEQPKAEGEKKRPEKKNNKKPKEEKAEKPAPETPTAEGEGQEKKSRRRSHYRRGRKPKQSAEG